MNIYPLFFLLFLAACNAVDMNLLGSAVISPHTFSGLSSIDQVTDTTARLNWSAHPDALSYKIYKLSAGKPSLITTLPASSVSYGLTNLQPGSSYSYLVRMIDATDRTDANQRSVAFTTKNAPNAPSALSLVTPGTNVNLKRTPLLKIDGVKSGDTVDLFTDSTCLTKVGGGIANGSSINLTTQELLPGVYQLYAKATNSYGSPSPCSTTSLSYEVLSCPANYSYIPANTTVGTNQDFCVMKFEARAWNDANTNGTIEPGEINPDGCNEPGCSTANWGLAHLPVSIEEGLPWRMINQTNARLRCQALNSPGEEKFDLISNPEWMTMARAIESVGANWSTGSIDNGCLFKGNTVSADTCGYSKGALDGGATAVRDSRARHFLPHGDTLWDVAGNLWEWTNWKLDYRALYLAPAFCSQFAIELWDVEGVCPGLNQAEYMPLNPNLDSTAGVGRFYSNPGGGAAYRGGEFNDNNMDNGIYALSLYNVATATHSSIGFRCVYRP